MPRCRLCICSSGNTECISSWYNPGASFTFLNDDGMDEAKNAETSAWLLSFVLAWPAQALPSSFHKPHAVSMCFFRAFNVSAEFQISPPFILQSWSRIKKHWMQGEYTIINVSSQSCHYLFNMTTLLYQKLHEQPKFTTWRDHMKYFIVASVRAS